MPRQWMLLLMAIPPVHSSGHRRHPQHRVRRPKRRVTYRNHPWAGQRFETRLDLALFENQETGIIRQRQQQQQPGKELSGDNNHDESYVTAVGDRISDSGHGFHEVINSPEIVVVVNDDTSLNNDDIDDNDNSSSVSSSKSGYDDDTPQSEERDGFEPIRIRAVLTEDSGRYLTVEEKNYLMDEILQPAMSAWSEALSVHPVHGNLTLDSSQLWDGESCGPGKDSGYPSPIIPKEHFSLGLNDTDLVIYTSLSFAHNEHDGYNDDIAEDIVDAIGREPGTSGRNPQDAISLSPSPSPSPTSFSYTRNDDESDENTAADSISSQISGVANEMADTPSPSAFQRGNHTAPQCIDPNTVASATYCSTDQFDRPVAGSIHFCINLGLSNPEDSFFHPSQRLFNIKATMHEIGHVLGFNAQSLAHFHHFDGTPRTPRDERGDVRDVEVQCTGPVSNGHPGKATIPLPDESTMKFQMTDNGVRFATVVTESVQMIVRNHFDCQDLEGAALEIPYEAMTTDGPESECITSHWDRKLFKADLMNPVVDAPSQEAFALLISPLTLGFFLDSGWYHVNLGRSSIADGWGRRAGCGFASESCLSKGAEVPPNHAPYFCNIITENPADQKSSATGCSADFSRKAQCDIVTHESDLDAIYDGFQYFGVQKFSYDADTEEMTEIWLGGENADLDYCPVYKGFASGQCSDPSSEKLSKAHDVEEFGVKNSRCVMSVIDMEDASICTPIACVVSDKSLRIKVEGHWERCEFAGQTFEITKGRGHVICPDPHRTCPTFACPHLCLGSVGGVCDYGTGECMCEKILPDTPDTILIPCEEQHRVSEAFKPRESAIQVSPSISNYYFEDTTQLVDDDSRNLFMRLFDFLGGASAAELAVAIFVVVISLVFLFLLFRRICRKLMSTAPGKSKLVASLLVNLRATEHFQRKSRAVVQLEQDAGMAHRKAAPHIVPGTSDLVYNASDIEQEITSTIGSDSTVEL